jgi:hypothetical protein
MYILKARIDYSMAQSLKALSPEKYQEFREAASSFDLPESNEVEYYNLAVESVVPIEEIKTILDFNYGTLELMKVKGLNYPAGSTQVYRNDMSAMAPVVNNTQVCVANNPLHEVDTVHWLEDACTEELQGYLNNKWRILAVCPSNDTRRPTYILGQKKNA